MKKYLAIAVFAASMYVGQAGAQQAINYSFAELGYVESEYDVADVDGDGYEFNLSIGAGQTLAVVVGHQDIEDGSAEASLTSLGFVYHKPYSNTGDMLFGLAALESEVVSPGGGDDRRIGQRDQPRSQEPDQRAKRGSLRPGQA